MPFTHNDLVNLLVKSGVSPSEARPAVNRCLLSMGAHAAMTYTAGGALAYFLAMNPATTLPYTAATIAAGAGYAFQKSPQCMEVRTAIRFWLATQL